MRAVRLNAAAACLFIVGSSCFALGSVPAYVDAVGGVAGAATYFIGSLFFTAASFLQLLLVRTVSPTAAEQGGPDTSPPSVRRRRLAHDPASLAAITQLAGTVLFNVSTLAALAHNASVQEQDEHVWRPDVFGSTLFIVSSVFGILALGGGGGIRRSLPWYMAWLNMLGSILFMAAALAGYVLPASGEVLDIRVDLVGTLLGALCFLLAAVLMFPAARSPVRPPPDRTTRPSIP
jgi:hypothetical protein